MFFEFVGSNLHFITAFKGTGCSLVYFTLHQFSKAGTEHNPDAHNPYVHAPYVHASHVHKPDVGHRNDAVFTNSG